MSEEFTCGHGIAEHAALHARLSSLLETVAINLEAHLASLDPADEVSRPEHDAYTTLVVEHRELSGRLRSLGELMRSYRGLPMANHAPAALGSREVMAAFEALLEEQEQVADLLRAWIERDRTLLEEIRNANGG